MKIKETPELEDIELKTSLLRVLDAVISGRFLKHNVSAELGKWSSR